MAKTPAFYKAERVGTLFYPDTATIAAGAEAAGLPEAARDQPQVLLLLIDMQVDFCHAEGALHVPGAQADIRRTIEFLYRHAERISHITCSLDSHYPHQIFHPAWWVGPDGRHPKPYTIISREDVDEGKWVPVNDPDWSSQYVGKLERSAQKSLCIWPYHVLLGGIGNMLDPELWSAVFWHSVARKSQPTWWHKGSIPLTEHYSVIQPEVPVPGHPESGTSDDFMHALQEFDHILVAGEAKSHCVLETVEDMVNLLTAEQRKKLYVLSDCTSAVQHPDIDFDAIAEEQFSEFEKKGVQFIDSSDALPF